MDDIRRRQIDEVLNYDKNVNMQVLDLRRKQVAKWERGEAGEMEDAPNTIDTANTYVNSLFVILDKRRADVNTISQWQFKGPDKIYNNAMSDIARISEVVDAYNQLVATYLSNNTAQTKVYY